jgi:O-antigen/teichoic acid export membrane protein
MLLNVVSVGANGYIIRKLGEDGYGSLVVALGLSGATTILANLGMRALYTKSIAGADDHTTERLMEEQLGLRALLAVLAGTIATAAAYLLYPHDLVVVACTAIQSAGLIATIGWTVLADVLNARERFRENAHIGFVAGLILTVLSVVAAALGGGPILVATAYLAGPAINFGLQARAVRRMGLRIRYRASHWQRYRLLLREARALALNDAVSTLVSRAQGVWAPLLFGKGLMGVFAAGTLPTSRLTGATDGVATAYFPAIAAAHGRNDSASMREHASGLFVLMLTVALPMGIIAFVAAPYFAALLFPSASQAEARALCALTTRVTAIGIPIAALNMALRYAVQAAGLHARNARQQMKATTSGAVVALAMAATMGLPGLAVSVVTSALLTTAMQLGQFRETFPCLLRSLPWGKVLATNLFLAGLAWGLIGNGDGLALQNAVLTATVLCGIYCFVAVRLHLIDAPWKRV